MNDEHLIREDDLLDLVDPFLRKHLDKKFHDYEPEERTICIKELLKFLYLSSKHRELKASFIPVTQEIDNFWHELILQTTYYQKLCASLPGGELVHHQSMPFSEYKEERSKEALTTEILQWFSLYVKTFGDLQEDRLKHWYFINTVLKTLNISLRELNQFAKDSPLPSKQSLQTWPKPAPSLTWNRWAEVTADGSISVDASERPIRMVNSDGTGEELLSHHKFGADLIRFAAGKGVKKHVHIGDHILFVLSGTGTVTFYNEVHHLNPGMCYLIPGNAPHAIDATTDLVLIAVGNDRAPVGSVERMELFNESHAIHH